jgi:NAD-dependent SIR2 family protein deacetylase
MESQKIFESNNQNSNELKSEDMKSMVNKKPENMEQLIVLFMEMNISYRILAARLDKVEMRLNSIITEVLRKD